MPKRRLLKLNDLEQESIRTALDQSANTAARTILQALLHLAEGKSRQQTAEEARVHPVTVTRWVRRFGEQGLEGLAQNGYQGRPLKLNPKQLEALNQMAQTPPRSLGKHFARWTLKRLARHFSQQLGLEVGSQHVGQQLGKMGLLRGAVELDGNSGFHAVPEAALIWVTVATTVTQSREKASDHRVLFAGFNLGSGGLIVHWATQKRPAELIEFLKSLSAAYPHQRVLVIIETGIVSVSRQVWKFLNSESGRLELVFHRPPTQRHKGRQCAQKLDSERRRGIGCFLFSSPEKLIENLRRDISTIKKRLAVAKEADFS